MSVEKSAAWCGGLIATQLTDYSNDISVLDSAGRWFVVIAFDGSPHCFRFESWAPGKPADIADDWSGPQTDSYASSLDQAEYKAAVGSVRESIATGRLYQANICRLLTAEMPDVNRADILALAALLDQQNPAPYAAAIRAPEFGIEIASASPELFLARIGDDISSGPIKGTATSAVLLSDKDRAENVMIADLVRNDLGRVCRPGTVAVPSLLKVEHHPTVVHLVSTVAGELQDGVRWPRLIDATFPPGSVSGAPKYSALQVIAEQEQASRGPYCGAIGWVDADEGSAQLAVAIRTFWKTRHGHDKQQLHFGTGAGITWGSDPAAEWEETQLKARHLTSVAAQEWSCPRR